MSCDVVVCGDVRCCTLVYVAVPCCTLLYLAVPCCTLLYLVVRCCTLLYLARWLHLTYTHMHWQTVEVNTDLVSRPNCTHTHTHTHTRNRNTFNQHIRLEYAFNLSLESTITHAHCICILTHLPLTPPTTLIPTSQRYHRTASHQRQRCSQPRRSDQLLDRALDSLRLRPALD